MWPVTHERLVLDVQRVLLDVYVLDEAFGKEIVLKPSCFSQICVIKDSNSPVLFHLKRFSERMMQIITREYSEAIEFHLVFVLPVHTCTGHLGKHLTVMRQHSSPVLTGR